LPPPRPRGGQGGWPRPPRAAMKEARKSTRAGTAVLCASSAVRLPPQAVHAAPAAGSPGPSEGEQGGRRDRASPCLEGLQGGLLFLLDVEEPVEPGDLEDLVDLGVDVAQDQAAARGLQLLVERDELTQGGARQVFHVAEVQQ